MAVAPLHARRRWRGPVSDVPAQYAARNMPGQPSAGRFAVRATSDQLRGLSTQRIAPVWLWLNPLPLDFNASAPRHVGSRHAQMPRRGLLGGLWVLHDAG